MKGGIPCRGGAIIAIAGSVNHLHIICTDPFFSRDKGGYAVVAVNVSSVKAGALNDNTCILHAGDHPFIKHDSFIYYKNPSLMRVSSIHRGIADGTVTVVSDVSDKVLQKIIDGFEKSVLTPRKFLKLIQEHH